MVQINITMPDNTDTHLGTISVGDEEIGLVNGYSASDRARRVAPGRYLLAKVVLMFAEYEIYDAYGSHVLVFEPIGILPDQRKAESFLLYAGETDGADKLYATQERGFKVSGETLDQLVRFVDGNEVYLHVSQEELGMWARFWRKEKSKQRPPRVSAPVWQKHYGPREEFVDFDLDIDSWPMFFIAMDLHDNTGEYYGHDYYPEVGFEYGVDPEIAEVDQLVDVLQESAHDDDEVLETTPDEIFDPCSKEAEPVDSDEEVSSGPDEIGIKILQKYNVDEQAQLNGGSESDRHAPAGDTDTRRAAPVVVETIGSGGGGYVPDTGGGGGSSDYSSSDSSSDSGSD